MQLPTQDLVGQKTVNTLSFDGKQHHRELATPRKNTPRTSNSIMMKEGAKQQSWKSKSKTKMAKEAVECMFAAMNPLEVWEDMTMASEPEELGTEVSYISDMDMDDQLL